MRCSLAIYYTVFAQKHKIFRRRGFHGKLFDVLLARNFSTVYRVYSGYKFYILVRQQSARIIKYDTR
jgi:hypothetical protein